MNSTRLQAIGLVVLMLIVFGCMDEPARILAPGSGEAVNVDDGDSAPPRTRVAAGHFTRQIVEVIDRDGSRSMASFRADYVVFSDGRASGNFSLFSEAGMVLYQITNGETSCENGEDVVLLSGVVVGGGGGRDDIFSASATPVSEDNPECIIWDIKDSCSHEAEGKHDVLQSACPR